MRNAAVYAIQGNRNPFIDHPEFIAAIWDSNSVTGVETPVAARSPRLAPARPNPASSVTRLAFELPVAQTVSLSVYDVQGHRVCTVASGRWEAGSHAVAWEGLDDAGHRVSNGLYFVRFEAGGVASTQRLSWIR
jgi:hypothetical protein